MTTATATRPEIEIPAQFFTYGLPVEEVKKTYKQWAMKIHPDLNPSDRDFCTEAMKILNKQYEEALRNCDKQESVGSDGKTHTYTYNHEREQGIQEIIDQLISKLGDRIASGQLDVMLIGIYIWISGTTREMTDVIAALKELNFRWGAQRGMWYWKPEDYKSRRSTAGLSELARKYGYENIRDEAKSSGKKRTNEEMKRLAKRL